LSDFDRVFALPCIESCCKIEVEHPPCVAPFTRLAVKHDAIKAQKTNRV
jgi:hypothetical protein